MAGGEEKAEAMEDAAWIVCGTSGGLSPALFDELAAAAARGVAITLGPRAPTLGGSRRRLATPFDLSRLDGGSPRVPRVLTGSDPRAIDAAVAAAIDALELPTWATDPDGIHTTLHEDADGQPRVLFVIRAGEGDVLARVAVGENVKRVHDVLEERSFVVEGGVLELRMPPRTVRMLTLES